MRTLRRIRVILVAGLVLAALEPAARASAPPTDTRIRYYQQILRRHPNDARAYYGLGDAYVQKGRETGDVTYFTLAEDALRQSLALAPQSSGATRHLAYVLYFRHAFEDAAGEATRAIERDPHDSHAYGILGDAYLEVGKYADAEQTYRRMAALETGLYALSRLAALKVLRGDPTGAIADLEQAIAEGQSEGRPAESIAWAQWQLGTEHFNLGDLDTAEAGYRAALATYPRYHRALAGLAQVRTAQGRYADAIGLYEQAIGIIPQPDYVAALGDVFAKTGRLEEAQRQYDLVEYIGRLSALNRVLYNRELASFYADHDTKLGEALDLARRELVVRRDIYAYDLLAWVLYKNRQAEDARAPMAEALRLGTRDARLFFHAGLIEHRLGHRELATTYLRRALATNPRFHIFHAEEARRLLGELDAQSARAPHPEGWHGE